MESNLAEKGIKRIAFRTGITGRDSKAFGKL